MQMAIKIVMSLYGSRNERENTTDLTRHRHRTLSSCQSVYSPASPTHAQESQTLQLLSWTECPAQRLWWLPQQVWVLQPEAGPQTTEDHGWHHPKTIQLNNQPLIILH